MHKDAAMCVYYLADKTSTKEGIANIFANITEELKDASGF